MADFVRDLQDVAAVREIHILQRRHFRDRGDPFLAYTDREFRNRYRLTKEAVRFVIELVEDDLEPMTSRQKDIPPSLQVLVTLRYFAKGCYQLELGDLHGISQPAVSRIVAKVSRAIARKMHQFVKWPNQMDAVKEAFHNIAGFPGVVGCVDCTQVKIKNPHGQQPLLYCNRKGFYSLNVQVVCDATTPITDIVARWRGSAHDARIWANSAIREQFESNHKKGILLGDSGYACSHYMLTPLLSPNGAAEGNYNRAHKSTRVTVECCFGRWKGMFRALQNGMQVSLETAKACISAMAVLYNIKLVFDEDWHYADEEDFENPDLEEEPAPRAAPQVLRGNLFRQRFIEQHFA